MFCGDECVVDFVKARLFIHVAPTPHWVGLFVERKDRGLGIEGGAPFESIEALRRKVKRVLRRGPV